MKKEITKSRKYLKEFISKTKSLKSETRGMTKSELLLIYTVIKETKVERILESGRARGFSTQILANCLPEHYEIISIDFDKYGEDVKYSEKKLKNFKHVSLLYGDSKKLIPKFSNKDCVVLVDGPKGEDAIIFCADLLLKFPKIKAIFIHDLQENLFERDIAKIIFPKAIFADDKKFIQEFSFLDSRKDKSKSHIALIYNMPNCVEENALENLKEYYAKNNKIFSSSLKKQLLQTGCYIPYISNC